MINLILGSSNDSAADECLCPTCVQTGMFIHLSYHHLSYTIITYFILLIEICQK